MIIKVEDYLEEISCSGIYYAFRNKKTQLYVGYDGFDTDFARGISAFIHEYELVSEFNKKLITKTSLEVVDLLTTHPMSSKEWTQLGGFNNLEIVRLEFHVDGTKFTPSELLNLFMSSDTDPDFEEIEFP